MDGWGLDSSGSEESDEGEVVVSWVLWMRLQ